MESTQGYISKQHFFIEHLTLIGLHFLVEEEPEQCCCFVSPVWKEKTSATSYQPRLVESTIYKIE